MGRMEFSCDEGRLRIDPKTGVLRELGVADFPRPLLDGGSGLFDIALPLPDELPHRLRVDAAQHTSDVGSGGEDTYFRYDALRSPRGTFQISAVLRVRPSPGEGFALRLELVNHTPHVIPQVLFPHLVGLNASGEPKHETLHLGRSIKHPHVWMTAPDGAAAFYDLYRRWYFNYGMGEWNLKWYRLGNERRGVAVFSKDLGATIQGLYVERERTKPRLTASWAHYPHVEPGETWVSPEFIVQPHKGDWRIGLEAYKAYAAPRLPTAPLPKYLRESLGVRSLYFSTYLYDNEPNFFYRDLPRAARDALAHGLKELVCWFLFDAYFELPMKLNPKLGSEQDLREAVAACRAMGVNPVAFVSCRSLKTSSAPASWFETDERGNRRTQAWTYSLDFVPPFNPLYCNRDESAFVCPGSAEYRQAFLAACGTLREFGFTSICYDQLFADRLCYVAEHRHKPQDLIAPLYGMVRQAHADGQQVDPDATCSGEFFNDVSQTFQHYNWDWITGVNSLHDLEPFRLMFPRYRLGLLVDRSLRWLLEGFVRGLLVNFLPEGGEGLIGSDPAFSELARLCAVARRRYARFFEEGEYLGTHGFPGPAEIISLYRHGDEWLLILANVSEDQTMIESKKLVPVALTVPATLLAPYDFRIIHWRTGEEDRVRA
jgi:hypothetical protein